MKTKTTRENVNTRPREGGRVMLDEAADMERRGFVWQCRLGCAYLDPDASASTLRVFGHERGCTRTATTRRIRRN